MKKQNALIVLFFFLSALSNLQAQWDPANGQWGKADPHELRVMTWNIQDGICSSNNKVEGSNNWTALARIIAAIKPDILILQEAGDNEGNGTGSGVDTVANLTTTIGLFLHGGNDPFKAGNPPVTSYVQLYAPSYDLPNIFVSNSTDGFNRNVILSRFSFSDLNGDGKSQLSDMPTLTAHLYAPGGTGGIRGFQNAEVDLADLDYSGNLVIGNSHLKAGGAASDHTQRISAAKNIAYYLDYFFNGGGLGVPDPFNKIADNPPATNVLDEHTLIILGGDWNEDELTDGTKGPAEWITQAQDSDASGGSDGTDRDRSDMSYDDARDLFTNARATEGSAKFDYIAWQDSIGGLDHSFIFNSATVTPPAAMPPELIGFPNPASASAIAADHRPVIVDFILPTPASCPADLDHNGNVDAADLGVLLGNWGGNGLGDLNQDGIVDAADLGMLLGDWGLCL